jgi:RND family efflux transporter MFP subunit
MVDSDKTKIVAPEAHHEDDDGFDANDPAHNVGPARTSLVVSVAVVAVIVLGAAFAVGFIPRKQRLEATAADAQAIEHEAVVVSVAKPRATGATADLSLPGTVRALQDTWINARASGYLKRWLVDIGDKVQAGQLLAEVEVPEVDQELLQMRAALLQLGARLELAKANVGLADSTLKRYATAAPAGGITPQELDEKRAGVEVQRATVSAAQADVAAGEANVRRLEQLHAFAQVTAPFAGTITARAVEVGTLIQAGNGQGQALFHIVQTNPVRVYVSVPQVDAPGITVGAAATLTIREYPQGKFEGKVARTAASIDDATRTLLVEVDVPNDDGALLTGMYTQVKFHMPQRRATYLIPQSALVVSGDGTQVIVIRDGKAHFQDVTIGTDFGSELAILSGVTDADEVATNPGEKLVEGVAVEISKPEPEAKKDAATTPAGK